MKLEDEHRANESAPITGLGRESSRTLAVASQECFVSADRFPSSICTARGAGHKTFVIIFG